MPNTKIVPSFPDIKVAPGGRFGGVLMGLQTMQQQGELNRKAAMETEKLNISKELLGVGGEKNTIALYNQYVSDQRDTWKERFKAVTDINKEIIKANKGIDPTTLPLENNPDEPDIMSYNDYKNYLLTGAMPQKAPEVSPVGAVNTPPPTFMQSLGQGLGQGVGQVMGRGAGMQVGSFGQNNLMQGITNTAAGLLPRAVNFGKGVINFGKNLLGMGQQTQAPVASQAPVTPTASNASSPTTEDILQALNDYDDLDSIIKDLIQLDTAYNEEGLAFGDDVDNNIIIEYLRRKFGDSAVQEALQTLQSRIQ